MIRTFFFAVLTIFSLAIGAQESSIVIWNSDKSASAFCSSDDMPVCHISINETNIDVSQVTITNIGKLGIAKIYDYEKVITKPIEWLKSSSDIQMVKFKTQAWRNGQSYTVTEPVLVKNGKYHVR